MKNSLLNDELFCEYIMGRINDLSSCKTSFDSVKAWWDFFKNSLRGDIIAFARDKRRRLNCERISPDRVVCEGILSTAKLTVLLKTLNTDKEPGPDGFTAEFYAKFWNLLGPLMTEVINKCFEDGCLQNED